jgi:phage tail sheath protein FI
VSEIDLTTVVPAVSSTEGAIAGVFRWGPVSQRVLLSSEQELVARFGKPTNFNAETFHTAANFLAYGNKLYAVRVANTTDSNATTGAWNALANTGAVTSRTNFNIKNEDDYTTKDEAGTIAGDTDVLYIAKYPGSLGNSLKVSVCDSNAAFSSNITTTNVTFNAGAVTATLHFAANADATAAYALLTPGDVFEIGNTSIGKQLVRTVYINNGSGPTGNTVTLQLADRITLASNWTTATSVRRYWEFHNSVDKTPGQSEYQGEFGNTAAGDEIHVVVVDEDGAFSGSPGTVLEVWEGLSRATDAKTRDGSANYYKTVINQNSAYVWFANDRTNAGSNTALNVATSTNVTPLTQSFLDGTDGSAEDDVAPALVTGGYDMFASAADIDVSLILAGKALGGSHGELVPNYIIDNICETRRDCVAFISPDRADVVRNVGDEVDDVVQFRNALRSSSYAVLDSGYKYQYDKYNDVYRWVPLNGDIAGLCVRTDTTRDPWWSPAGYNRGQVKNIVRLAYNPDQADRDVIFKAGVNPVITVPGQGTLLFGDKTLSAKPSAFDAINVRRLFIVLEKAIATAAKYTLFEFNDEFTRAQFRNLVEPFLRDVQGRRGIYDFRVVCDETNNTGEVIDRNEFIGDIYIKPARAIRYIQLNFVAVRTGVEFSEIVGQF